MEIWPLATLLLLYEQCFGLAFCIAVFFPIVQIFLIQSGFFSPLLKKCYFALNL